MDTSTPWRAIEAPENTKTDATVASSRRAGSRVLLVAAAVLVAASAGAALFVASKPAGEMLVASDSSGSPGPTASATTMVVEVAGAVAHPGVYSLSQGSRVADAIKAAGGYSPDVDPRQAEMQLNLAALIQDAQLIRVPRKSDSTASGASPGPRASNGGLLDLNTATVEQLDTLPGIGPVTAQKIVAAREQQPFRKPDDLVTRKVVSAAVLAKIRTLITVG